MHSKLSILSATALSSGLFCSAAALAATDQEELLVIGLQQQYLTEQAHAAMRSDVSLLETPQSVTVIPAEVMADQLILTLGDALRNDASVSIGRVTTDRERFSMRGFSLDESTNLLKNGHQHFAKYRLPMDLVDRVEVLKGPSSLLYGQSTPGGLINLVTKQPTAEAFADIAVKGDEHGSVSGSVDAGGSLNETGSVRYRAIVAKENNKNWRRYQDGSQQESEFLVGSLMTDIDLTDKLTLSLHYDKSDEVAGQDSGALVDANGDVVGGDEMIWDMDWTKVDAQSENYGADIRYQLSHSWKLDAGYNRQHNQRERIESKPQTSSYNPDTGSYKNKPDSRLEDWQQQSFYFDFSGAVSIADMQHDLVIGGNYLKHEYSSLKVKDSQKDSGIIGTGISQPELDYADGKTKTEEYNYYGLYAQDLITFNQQWQLLLGLRYDEQNKTDADSDSLLPKLGLIYHPSANASLYANYSESFEPQGMVDDDDDANFGMQLEPIVGEMYELGAKWELMSGKLRLNVASFDIKRKNILINAGDSDNPITTQGGEQRHQGFEVGAIGQINDQLSLITSAMYLDARYEAHDEFAGNRPEDVPEWTASVWAKYTLGNRLALNLGAFYEGERYGDAANTFSKDAYTRIDTGVSYIIPMAEQRLQLRLKVENLFNTGYLGGGENGEVNVGKPRTVKVGMNYSF